MFILAVPASVNILREGQNTFASSSVEGLRAALMLAHFLALPAFAFALGLSLVKKFVLKSEGDPVFAFAFALRDSALISFTLGACAECVLFILATFYLFYGRLIADYAGPWVLLPHLLAISVLFFALAVLVAALLRKFMARPGIVRRANLFIRIGVFPWLFCYGGMVLGPALLKLYSPELLDRLGTVPGPWVALLPPLALLYGAAGLGWQPAALSASLLFLSLPVALWALKRWYRHADRDLVLDFGAEPGSARRSFFERGHLRFPFRGPSAAGAFWIKDLVLPALRSPSSYLQQLVLCLSSSAVLIFMLARLRKPDSPPGFLPEYLVTLWILVISGLFAMAACLPAFGMEGLNLALLRPLTGLRRLFWIKLRPRIVWCLAHGIPFALLLALAARQAGLSAPSPLESLWLGLAGSLAFAALGMALGARFPDLQRRSVTLPGASRLASLLFLGLLLATAGPWAGMLAAADPGTSGRLAAHAAGAMLALLLAALSAVVSLWGLRSLERFEL